MPRNSQDLTHASPTLAAIDFGISNTDAVVRGGGSLHRWTRASDGAPDDSSVHDVLAQGTIDTAALRTLAITGGRHRQLPARIGALELVPVHEITAIGRGGQALGLESGAARDTPLLVVSAGSGTAVIAARGDHYAHITGTGVGGGTLLGLARLLLGTTNVADIDTLAMAGDANGVDLSLKDVISGPIGALPPEATAVNFGRLATHVSDSTREDLAAALVTLVAQVIAITAINAARAQQMQHVVVIGHLTDMPSVRNVMHRVGTYYDLPLTLPEQAGFATALGALLHVEQRPPVA